MLLRFDMRNSGQNSPIRVQKTKADQKVNVPPAVPIKVSSRGAWLLQWKADERKTIYLFAFILATCFFFFLFYVLKLWQEYQLQTAGRLPDFGDFFAFWSYAKFVSTHRVAELYDFTVLHPFQAALGMDPNFQQPFPYPPTFIIFLWPLNLLPFELAYLVWTVVTLVLFVWAVIATCTRLPLCVLGAILAPASIFNIAFGQSGFFSAALIIGGVRLAGSKPIVSGILIGILSYKPQLGFLVPIALASAGHWRAFGAACVTVLGLAAIATVAFGWAVWPAWVSMLPAYSAIFHSSTNHLQLMPTVMANLQMAGISLPIAAGVQTLVTITVAICVSVCFRRNPSRLATAALLTGTFVGSPHAVVYDMPMVAAALALFIEARMETTSVFSLAEVLILVLALMFPLLMMKANFDLPVSAAPMLLLFVLILKCAKSETHLTMGVSH
jgi:hypothetical protein